jgi:hypothetical protein
VLLSENGLDHARMALAGLWVGVPVAPIAPADALRSSDGSKLSSVIASLDPGLVFVAHRQSCERALARLAGRSFAVAAATHAMWAANVDQMVQAWPFLAEEPPVPLLEQDESLRGAFFRRLRFIESAAAAPQLRAADVEQAYAPAPGENVVSLPLPTR